MYYYRGYNYRSCYSPNSLHYFIHKDTNLDKISIQIASIIHPICKHRLKRFSSDHIQAQINTACQKIRSREIYTNFYEHDLLNFIFFIPKWVIGLGAMQRIRAWLDKPKGNYVFYLKLSH